MYALLSSSKNDGAAAGQYLIFHISDLAYTTYIADGVRKVTVSERQSGAPAQGVKVAFYEQNYNPGIRRYDYIKSGEYQTDSKGNVSVSGKLERNFKIVISRGNDILDLNRYHYNYGGTENNEFNFAEFYTDRSIYRPGQTVFYKTILLHRDKNQIPSIIPNETVEIIFRDANYQEISRQKLKSNEFLPP